MPKGDLTYGASKVRSKGQHKSLAKAQAARHRKSCPQPSQSSKENTPVATSRSLKGIGSYILPKIPPPCFSPIQHGPCMSSDSSVSHPHTTSFSDVRNPIQADQSFEHNPFLVPESSHMALRELFQTPSSSAPYLLETMSLVRTILT